MWTILSLSSHPVSSQKEQITEMLPWFNMKQAYMQGSVYFYTTKHKKHDQVKTTIPNSEKYINYVRKFAQHIGRKIGTSRILWSAILVN